MEKGPFSAAVKMLQACVGGEQDSGGGCMWLDIIRMKGHRIPVISQQLLKLVKIKILSTLKDHHQLWRVYKSRVYFSVNRRKEFPTLLGIQLKEFLLLYKDSMKGIFLIAQHSCLGIFHHFKEFCILQRIQLTFYNKQIDQGNLYSGGR